MIPSEKVNESFDNKFINNQVCTNSANNASLTVIPKLDVCLYLRDQDLMTKQPLKQSLIYEILYTRLLTR